MVYNPKDFYFKKAKKENFAARSVYKLEEIDLRYKVVKTGIKVLDLGCAPGSWSQYVSKKIGPKGICLGVDLQRVALTMTNTKFLQGDAFDESVISAFTKEQGIENFDLVLSDMAPKTTGIRLKDQLNSYDLCKRALEVAIQRLKPNGHFVVKFFQSEFFEDYVKSLRPLFDRVQMLRPKSTRQQSIEIFIIGLNKK